MTHGRLGAGLPVHPFRTLQPRRMPYAGSVIVVDDDALERAGAEAQLAAHGYLVRSTGDASEALELVRHSRADIVVIGLAEESSTLDLIRRLRGRFEALPLPSPPQIVALVDDRDERQERFARSLGASIVLHRPCAAVELTAAVRQLVCTAGAGTPLGREPRSHRN